MNAMRPTSKGGEEETRRWYTYTQQVGPKAAEAENGQIVQGLHSRRCPAFRRANVQGARHDSNIAHCLKCDERTHCGFNTGGRRNKKGGMRKMGMEIQNGAA
jgi:hypothetical protein